MENVFILSTLLKFISQNNIDFTPRYQRNNNESKRLLSNHFEKLYLNNGGLIVVQNNFSRILVSLTCDPFKQKITSQQQISSNHVNGIKSVALVLLFMNAIPYCYIGTYE